MRAIEVASQKQWNFLWLETDSMLVVQAFKSSILVPWQVRNRWNNVQLLLANMHCIVTHIFKEGNQLADSLANFGLSLNHYEFLKNIPLFARESYVRNKIGLPDYRFPIPSFCIYYLFLYIYISRVASSLLHPLLLRKNKLFNCYQLKIN